MFYKIEGKKERIIKTWGKRIERGRDRNGERDDGV